ncbi:MAG: IclR family transcriptional regulator [Deltaproteobacteria bacterium]|nr:IclR family transcriptional regulator [Deltaproteobacteria bacterium]
MHTLYSYNKSVAKGLDILDLLSEQGALSDKQISTQLQYNLLIVQQLLLIYMDFGYISQSNDGLYDLSIKVIDISRKFRQRSKIKDVARVHLQRLSEKYNETTTLGTIEKTNIIYIDKIDSMELLRFVPVIEQQITAHHTALGKSILAYLPVKELNHYCNLVHWKAKTPKTIDSKAKLFIRLEQIRKQGFAISDEEYTMGVRSIAIAILDALNYPKFSIGIWGPVARMTPSKLRQMQVDLTEASLEISKYFTMPLSKKELPPMPVNTGSLHRRIKRNKIKKGFFERALTMFL